MPFVGGCSCPDLVWPALDSGWEGWGKGEVFWHLSYNLCAPCPFCFVEDCETVIDDLGLYKDWTFLYTKIKRQVGSTAFNTYEKDAGLEQITGSSFVNLLIALAVRPTLWGPWGPTGTASSNELRLTNGRLQSSYMTLKTMNGNGRLPLGGFQ